MKKALFSLVVLVAFGLILSSLAFAGGQKEQAAPAQSSTPAASQPTAAAQTAGAGVAEDVKTHQSDPNNLFANGIASKSYAGAHIVAVSQTGPQVSGPLQEYKAMWEKKTGGTVEVQTFAFGDLFQKIRTAFVSGANPFDLLVYASDWAGDIMGSGYVVEVPKSIQDQMGFQYLIPAYKDRILSWGGKIYGLPYDGDAHMMYYRRDLLTNPTYQQQFKAQFGYDLPAPPKTWQQYYDIAKFFNGKTIDGQTIYGAGTAFKPHAQSYWTFLGIAASFAKSPGDPAYFFDPSNMKPLINNPGFVKALDLYTSLVKVGPPGVVNWDVGDIRSNFPAGKVVEAIDWGDVGPLSSDANSSVVIGKWGSALEPGVDQYWSNKQNGWVNTYNQAPYLAFGGWIQGVTSTSKNKEAALDFAAFMGSANMSLRLSTEPGTGVNPHYFSDLNNLAPWDKLGMTSSQAKEYLDAIGNIIGNPNNVVDLRIPGAAEYFDALDTQLAQAVAGQISSKAALDNVAAQWDKITDRIGRAQQQKLYRQMLGLPPQ
ncbi:MAG TPA: extracellular solute-binding protein [Spirochaetia bacterium]|nr:extracellular solute-binding protein [Spirochaetia bacterium]